MYELKRNGKVFMSKFVGTGPSPYEKRIYRAAVSQRLRNTALYHCHNLLDLSHFVFMLITKYSHGDFYCCSTKLYSKALM